MSKVLCLILKQLFDRKLISPPIHWMINRKGHQSNPVVMRRENKQHCDGYEQKRRHLYPGNENVEHFKRIKFIKYFEYLFMILDIFGFYSSVRAGKFIWTVISLISWVPTSIGRKRYTVTFYLGLWIKAKGLAFIGIFEYICIYWILAFTVCGRFQFIAWKCNCKKQAH